VLRNERQTGWTSNESFRDEVGIRHVAALFIDDGLGVGHVVSEPLAMLARHEHVGQAVKDAGRDGDLGDVEAPRLDQTEDVVDIAPDALTECLGDPLPKAGLVRVRLEMCSFIARASEKQMVHGVDVGLPAGSLKGCARPG
jgi:hypothetical protein